VAKLARKVGDKANLERLKPKMVGSELVEATRRTSQPVMAWERENRFREGEMV
jgi:hypothetical protein